FSTGQISLNGVLASRRCFFVGVAIPFRQENVLNRRLPLRVLVLRQTPARTPSRWFYGNDICPVEKIMIEFQVTRLEKARVIAVLDDYQKSGKS
ncbi:MAG: hypothetical protein RBS68_15940, partial [Anaerolineales bacterium]|nr:hypothetical protein [Anaerolineales bacterium]